MFFQKLYKDIIPASAGTFLFLTFYFAFTDIFPNFYICKYLIQSENYAVSPD